MGGDNTTGMKAYRAYKRLLISILEDSPLPIQRMYLIEYETEVDEHISLSDVLRDSRNYVVHYQSGRALLISRNSPLTSKVVAEGEEAKQRRDDDVIRRKLQNRPMRDYENP